MKMIDFVNKYFTHSIQKPIVNTLIQSDKQVFEILCRHFKFHSR